MNERERIIFFYVAVRVHFFIGRTAHNAAHSMWKTCKHSHISPYQCKRLLRPNALMQMSRRRSKCTQCSGNKHVKSTKRIIIFPLLLMTGEPMKDHKKDLAIQTKQFFVLNFLFRLPTLYITQSSLLEACSSSWCSILEHKISSTMRYLGDFFKLRGKKE